MSCLQNNPTQNNRPLAVIELLGIFLFDRNCVSYFQKYAETYHQLCTRLPPRRYFANATRPDF